MRAAVLFAFLLASCGDGRPPAPSAAESEQLNQAEDLLDAEAGTEKGPEDRSPGPSR